MVETLHRKITRPEFERMTFLFRGIIDSAIVSNHDKKGEIIFTLFRLAYKTPRGLHRGRFIARGILSETIQRGLSKGQEVAVMGNPSKIPYKPGQNRPTEFREGIEIIDIKPITQP